MLKGFFLFLILLLPVSSTLALTEPDLNGTLRFALGGEVSLLNPILSTDSVSSAVEGVIFSGLVKVNEKLELVPDLAERWTVSPDGKTWTFYLRRDARWHDGAPLTAADAKFTFDSILDPKVNSVRRGDYIIDGQPIRFSVVDKYTFRAVLPKPFAPFLSRMGMALIPRHLLAGKDLNTAPFNRQPIGSGPFRLTEWRSGQRLVVERNKDYYGGAPLLSKIIYQIIPDENSRLVAFEADELDSVGVPAKEYSRLKNYPGARLYEYDSLNYTYLGLNLANPKFADRRVRQALAYATDRKQLISLIFRGLASPAYAPSAPVSWAYSDQVAKYLYDPEKAKKLLKEAGVKDLEFTILINQGNKEREKAAVILQQQYKKIGVKVKIKVLEWSALLKVVNAPQGPKDFEAVLMGWSLGLDPDAYSIWHSSQYPRGFNFINYQNKEVDRLLEQGRLTIGQDKRKEIYRRLWQLIAEDQPYIFLWYPKNIVAVRDRVGGLSPAGPAGLFLNIEKVFIKK